MKIAVFSTKPYDRDALDCANEVHGHELVYFEPRLSLVTASLVRGFDAICFPTYSSRDTRASSQEKPCSALPKRLFLMPQPSKAAQGPCTV